MIVHYMLFSPILYIKMMISILLNQGWRNQNKAWACEDSQKAKTCVLLSLPRELLVLIISMAATKKNILNKFDRERIALKFFKQPAVKSKDIQADNKYLHTFRIV